MQLLSSRGCIGHIKDLGPDAKGGGRSLEIGLHYDSEGNPPFKKLKKISKCSLRRYSDVSHLSNLLRRYPHQIFVLSTDQGVMTANKAVENNKGGELLFKVC